MQPNTILNIDFLNNDLPDKCANLIIADPPYFEVKGSFDFVWNSFDDYLKDVEKWAIECKRLLTDNGTLFWYGHAKKIAYSQIILDRYFNLENHAVWHKYDAQAKKGVEYFNCFAPVKEHLLMYSNEVIRTGLEEIKLDINNFKPLRDYFEYVQKVLRLPKKAFLDKIGQSADHCFRWGSSQWGMPTKETYNELIKVFKINLLSGFKEYEELRQEYEELRRPFNNVHKLTDVLKFSQESHVSRKYNHDTIKPETLTRALIQTCSRRGDTVVVPFAGSGTECAMAAKEKRIFYGFDIDAKHVQTSTKRANAQLRTTTLF